MLKDFSYSVTEQVYDPKSMLDEQNFYHQNQGKVSELTRTLTYILGDYTGNYPISMMTMGNIASKTTVQELDDVQFTYPIMGRDDKASTVHSSSYSGADKPGVGHSVFTVNFTDNWMKREYIIESANGIQAYITKDPEPNADGSFAYELMLDPADADDFCPLSELAPGTLWSDLTMHVAESESRGGGRKMVAPGKWKNQMGFMRCSMEWAGNSANRVMNIEVNTGDGSTTTGWMDFAMFQFEKRCLNEYEHAWWYSRYNRHANGNIPLKDLYTGKVVPRGSGLLEQIQNKSTFSTLSFNFLSDTLGDALFGQSDTSNGVAITLHTGKGGLRDVDSALLSAGFTKVGDFSGIADKFVTGQGGAMHDLMLGGFFTGFYHIDGHVIRTKYNPIFDMGKVAIKSPKHPITGFPLESHRIVAIDDNDYDGLPNIMHVAQKGRGFLHGVVRGMAPMPRSIQIMGGNAALDSEAAAVLSTDVDVGSYHRFKSGGVQMRRGNRSFDMTCIAGT